MGVCGITGKNFIEAPEGPLDLVSAFLGYTSEALYCQAFYALLDKRFSAIHEEDLEDLVSCSAECAYKYAKFTGKILPKSLLVILHSPYAHVFAIEVMGARWPAYEELIGGNPTIAQVRYATHFDVRIPALEQALLASDWTYLKVDYVARFPDAAKSVFTPQEIKAGFIKAAEKERKMLWAGRY